MAMPRAVTVILVLYCIHIGASLGLVLRDASYSKCQSLRPPFNGLVQCSQTGTQLVCTATCNQGYQFDTGKKFENRVCDDSTGVWADGNIFPFCVSKIPTNVCPADNLNANTDIKCLGNSDKLLCYFTCAAGYKFSSGQLSVVKTCDVTSKTWEGGDDLQQCVKDTPVTVCNSSVLASINDTQFKASSVWTGVTGYYFGADRARLESVVTPDGTKAVKSGGWRPAANTLDQYLEVRLNEITRITGIITKGRNVLTGDTANEYVTKFRVLHSKDGKSWEPYSTINVSDQFLDGNTDNESPVLNTFTCPFDALYVRVNPLVWHQHIGLRFDLLGCSPSSGPNSCTDVETTTAQQTTEKIPTTPTEATTRPPHLCYPIPPPTNGVVNCEESGNQLVCVANCYAGYSFATNEVLVKRVCLQQSGAWPAGQGFPACKAMVQPSSAPNPTQNTTGQCLNVQKRCNRINNGDYQACSACHFFATCSEGYLYVRACPENLLFDSISGKCDFHSRTCPENSIAPGPVG